MHQLEDYKYVSLIFIATYLSIIILIINVNHFDSRRELTVSYFFCLLFRYEQLSKEEKNVEMLHSVQEAKWYSATD